MNNKYLTRLLLPLLVAGIFTKAFAQQLPAELYQASTIPDSLKENANSVVRYHLESDNIIGTGKMISKMHTIVTVLNEKADKEAEMVLYYDKYYSHSNIVMRVYDANGNVIKKYHKSDMADIMPAGGADLVRDGRLLVLRHTIASYPTTIEIEYEEQANSFFDIGRWEVQANEQSIQNSNYQVVIDSTAGFRYLNRNTSIKPEIGTTSDGKKIYAWEVKNRKAIKLEEGAEGWRVFPHIYFSQDKFNMEGYPGDISTWQNYGKWQKDLNADVNSLTPEREAEIRKMTDTIKTDRDKAKFLYRYLQQNTRYVSVQLGIGGWKPFAATFVDQKKYGDCKALSNYMSALLKAVGIKSYYAIINAEANREPADSKFPMDPFNHVILCIPFKADTTWLECTSSDMPFGKLGSFTENRKALLVTEDGGRLVSTPRSSMEDNQFNAEAYLKLNADGSAKAQIKVLATGGYRMDFVERAALKLDEQKEWVMRQMNIRQPSEFDYKPSTDKDGVKEVNINLDYDKFSDIMTGDKQFYRPHVFDLVAFTVPAEEHRLSDYYFETPMQKSCVTTIDLPDGFEVESLPSNQSLKFTYGSYDISYTYDKAKNQVMSTAKFIITN